MNSKSVGTTYIWKKIMKQTKMLIIGILTFISSIVTAGSPNQSQDVPTICLEEGACFKGTWYESTNDSGTRFASFQGIRYVVCTLTSILIGSNLKHS